jgi:hypothetical protein
VDEHIAAPLGVYVMSGDDTDPPTRYQYDAELLATRRRFLVRLRQHQTRQGERLMWFVSDDAGRSWREAAIDSAPSDARSVHLVRGKLEPDLLAD